MEATTSMLDAEADSEDDRLRIFDVHERRLFRLARRLSSCHDDAADLVQDTFLRAFGVRTSLPQDPREQEKWLITAMVNLARDRSRRHAIRASSRAEPVSESGDLEARYLAKLVVEQLLARLKPRRRAIVILHEIEGEPVTRVAQLLGVMPVTVRWHLAMAKKELSTLLGGGDES
jgi:RNA polymerase sigma-70 factor (ECF subfamily)